MVISIDDALWDQYIKRLPEEKQDIYFTRQYCFADQQLKDGHAELYVYVRDDAFVVYPYVRRQIRDSSLKQPYYDIETPYGYGGPVANRDDPELLECFETEFLDYCKKKHIIAEFIRFHPLLKNENSFGQNIEVLHNRTTVWLDLKKSLDEIWMADISKQNRNIIRKCKKNGLYVEQSTNYKEFREIYEQTMQRVGAGKFYFFGKSYYDGMNNDVHYMLMRVRRNEDTLACAVFMRQGIYFHYHLSGSAPEFLKLSPNNLLLWEAIKYAKKIGCEIMHFGGGLTDSEEDTLFQFKRKFSHGRADFFIGKRVHDEEIYWKLIKKWEGSHGETAKILLQYRE